MAPPARSLASTASASSVPRGVALASLRARQWAHFVVLPLAALRSSEMAAPTLDVALRAARGLALASFALAFAYGLNAISDRATDLDRRKNPLAGRACPASVTAVVVSTAGAALALGATAHRATLAAVAISLASSTVYSVGPRLKMIPGVGTLLNVGIFAPLLFVAIGEHPPASLTSLAIAFVALLLQNQLLHERADATEDEAARALTTARALGPTATTAIVFALGVGGVVACAVSSPSASLGWTAAGTFALATTCTFARGPWTRRRAIHRWVSFVAGAALFVVASVRQ